MLGFLLLLASLCDTIVPFSIPIVPFRNAPNCRAFVENDANTLTSRYLFMLS